MVAVAAWLWVSEPLFARKVAGLLVGWSGVAVVVASEVGDRTVHWWGGAQASRRGGELERGIAPV